jgi:hypothetical protein
MEPEGSLPHSQEPATCPMYGQVLQKDGAFVLEGMNE